MPSDSTVSVAAPAALADYTDPELLVPRLRGHDTPGIISELSQTLQRHGCLPDVLPFYQAALNHELLANSAMDCGIAVPHARLGAIKRLQFAFGRLAEPVVWGAGGSRPVGLVFLLAVPATDATAYLHLLASLARLAQEPDTMAALRHATSPQKILTLLRKIPIRQTT